ncbi:hypothetical protein [Bacillus stratosphericus]|nr:hypothetical protein [Bacillus stratosphericus]
MSSAALHSLKPSIGWVATKGGITGEGAAVIQKQAPVCLMTYLRKP